MATKKSGMYCAVCGKPLSVKDKKTICSTACRMKRSRDKREARTRSIRCAEFVESLIPLLQQGVIDIEDARACMYEINGAIHKLFDAVDQAHLAIEAKRAQDD